MNVVFKPVFFTILFHFHQEALQFLLALCHKGFVICISETIDISPGNLDSSLCFIQSSILHDVLCILNKQGDNIPALTYSFTNLEPVHCSMSGSNCCFFTYMQISQEAGQVVWYSHLLKNFRQSVVIHVIRGFGVVSKRRVGVFLELYCFFNNPMEAGNLMSCSSTISKSSLNIWNFSVHVLLKPHVENFELYFVCVMSAIVQ